MRINKRAIILLVILIALLLAACGGGEKEVKPPSVKLQVSGQTFEENVYSFCWPDSAKNWVCEVDEAALAQPAQPADVSKDDEVKFLVANDVGTVDRITAQVIGVSGEEDLGSGPEAVFDPQLADGTYRVQVDVEYASVEGIEIASGEKPYVSYVFGLQVAGLIPPTPTPTLTPIPTDTATPTNTPEPTATSPDSYRRRQIYPSRPTLAGFTAKRNRSRRQNPSRLNLQRRQMKLWEKSF
jgi:hypothetical protein